MITWTMAMFMCVASIWGFCLIVVFARDTWARRAGYGAAVSGWLALLCILMLATR